MLFPQESQVYTAITNEYTQWSRAPLESPKEVRDQMLEILSDAQITAPVLQMGELHSDLNERSYFYVFKHQSVFGDYPVVSTAEGLDVLLIMSPELMFCSYYLKYSSCDH